MYFVHNTLSPRQRAHRIHPRPRQSYSSVHSALADLSAVAASRAEKRCSYPFSDIHPTSDSLTPPPSPPRSLHHHQPSPSRAALGTFSCGRTRPYMPQTACACTNLHKTAPLPPPPPPRNTHARRRCSSPLFCPHHPIRRRPSQATFCDCSLAVPLSSSNRSRTFPVSAAPLLTPQPPPLPPPPAAHTPFPPGGAFPTIPCQNDRGQYHASEKKHPTLPSNARRYARLLLAPWLEKPSPFTASPPLHKSPPPQSFQARAAPLPRPDLTNPRSPHASLPADKIIAASP